MGRCERVFHGEERGRNQPDVSWNRKARDGRAWQAMRRVVGMRITREFVWIELLFSFLLFVVLSLRQGLFQPGWP